MKTVNETAEVGIIVGRFQVPSLHEAHKELIQTVVNKHPRVLIIDDLTESVGTLIEAAQTCRDHGADLIYVAVTHGCFNRSVAFPRLNKAFNEGVINKFFVSNTVNFSFVSDRLETSEMLETVDISPVFAKAILNINKNESVSELFSV